MYKKMAARNISPEWLERPRILESAAHEEKKVRLYEVFIKPGSRGSQRFSQPAIVTTAAN
jgi:hypothetical protein